MSGTATVVSPEICAAIVNEVFHGMAGMTVTPERCVTESVLDVAGVVSMSGGRQAAVIVRVSRSFAMLAASGLLQESIKEWGPMVEDAMGEVTNILAGNLKRHIASGLTLSPPAVVYGQDFSVRLPGLMPMQAMDFQHMGHPLRLIVAMQPEK